MPAAKKTAPRTKPGKFVLGYYYANRGKKYVITLDNATYATKETAAKAAETLLNTRTGRYYDEILILETISKVALERVPVKMIEVE